MTSFRAFLVVSSLSVCAVAQAQAPATQDYYRWKDANGVTHYGDAAPAGTAASRVSVSNRHPDSAVSPTVAVRTDATADESRLQKAEAAARQRNCTRARSNLQTLSGNAMLVDSADATTAKRMSPEAVAEARKAAQANADTYCDGGAQ